MSVATELTKLNTNIKNAYDEIATKGGTIPQNKNTDNLATAISSISGGGSSIDEYIDTNGSWTQIRQAIIKTPDLTTSANSISYCFSNCQNLVEVGNITGLNVTNMHSMFEYCPKLTTIGTLTCGNVTDMAFMFYNCTSLETAPNLDTSHCTALQYMFENNQMLKNVPVYNWSSATNLNYIFNSCIRLTDQSLDNILQSCISATSFTGSKNLRNTIHLGYTYSKAKIQSLPHYQDFINAGWVIGD